MPHGKPAGVPCVQLGPDQRCLIFGQPERPAPPSARVTRSPHQKAPHHGAPERLPDGRTVQRCRCLPAITNWAKPVGIDLSHLTHLLACRQRISERPAVLAAMQAEGLIK